MHKVLIEDIENEPDKILRYNFDEFMQEFDTNIQSNLILKSLDDFIEVKGHANGKLKLICDRCIASFDYVVDIDINEIFAKNALQDEYSQEFELSSGQFVEDLNGAKEIDIYDVLYQSVILSLPNKKVCGINCKGGMFVSEENMQPHDNRMDIFKTIKIDKN